MPNICPQELFGREAVSQCAKSLGLHRALSMNVAFARLRGERERGREGGIERERERESEYEPVTYRLSSWREGVDAHHHR